MKKLFALLAGVVALPVLALTAGNASAATFYSNIGGGNIFQSKNVTQNGAYNDPTSAACNDVVRFRLYLHNAGPETADSVNVKVAFPGTTTTNHVVTATATPNNADPSNPSVSDTATVTTNQAGVLQYVAGSAEYFDNGGNRLGALSDTVTTTGAALPGGLGVSINNARYVGLNAKVTCQAQPKDIQVCELSTKKIITIKENQFDATKHSKNLADCATTTPGNITVCDMNTGKIVTIKENEFDAAKHSKDLNNAKCKPAVPTTLVDTGAGDVFGMFAAVTVAGAIAYRLRLAIASRFLG